MMMQAKHCANYLYDIDVNYNIKINGNSLMFFFLPAILQWNPSIADTLGTAKSVLISEVSTFQG